MGKVRDIDEQKRIKNRALLRSLSYLSPVLKNLTHCASAYNLFSRFHRIRNELISVATSEKIDLTVDMYAQFKNNFEQYEKQFKEINTIALELQKRCLSLADCRLALDILVDAVKTGKNDLNSKFYNYALDNYYIYLKAPIGHSPHFESEVIKIQNNKNEDLTAAEILAYKGLERVSSSSRERKNNKRKRRT